MAAAVCKGDMENVASKGDYEYDEYIECMRRDEYPMLGQGVYVDHAGTTLYSKRQMDRFHTDMMTNLYGNPHSASPSSLHSSVQIESIRLELLKFFNADPAHFDLVFTANATAGIKILMEALREQEGGFRYAYHADSHTSLVGLREVAVDHICFQSDKVVSNWLGAKAEGTGNVALVGYPAQSNMNGRRLPLEWCRHIRQRRNGSESVYTLLDAAAYASTSPLDFGNVDAAPNFTVLSLYKIFGFPDLGALIVRKDAANLFRHRKYFGGGTVDMVICMKEQWHAPKSGSLHERLEDGTLPIHSILALKSAMQSHVELFGSQERISKHVSFLTNKLHRGVASLKHRNGKSVCRLYSTASPISNEDTRASHGPIVAFNIQDYQENYISLSEVEKLASIKNIHLRTGGLCNPGGIASNLELEPWEMRHNFSAGFRCGADNDILNGKPTGVIRASFGPMSTCSDVDRLIMFLKEFFMEDTSVIDVQREAIQHCNMYTAPWHIESLTVYPIKSCAGWRVPSDKTWEVRDEGLAWDREWCVVHLGTGVALSQKRYPRMALIRPDLDFKTGRLRIKVVSSETEITVPLSHNPSYYETDDMRNQNATVCGDAIQARMYISSEIADFLTKAVGTPCTLARFPRAEIGSISARHSKQHLASRSQKSPDLPRPILLSNESPILTISRSSLNRLNELIKDKCGKAAHPSVFRANIILAEPPFLPPGQEQPWSEDLWHAMTVGRSNGPRFEFLGGCRRCQMVCVDQESGEKNEEPFVTLAKTRRFGGRVLFGVHTSLVKTGLSSSSMIQEGDVVDVYT